MTLLDSDNLPQTAVYWPPGSADSGGVDYDDDGDPQYGTAVEISCRWEDKTVEFLNSRGATVVSRARVYTDTDLVEGGVLWLGTLATVSDLADPKANDSAWEIRGFDKSPSIDADEYVRKAYL